MTMWIQVSFKLKINIYWSLFFVNAISHNFTLGNRTVRSWFIIFLVIVSFAVKAFSRSVFDLQAWYGGLGQYLPLANSPILHLFMFHLSFWINIYNPFKWYLDGTSKTEVSGWGYQLTFVNASYPATAVEFYTLNSL